MTSPGRLLGRKFRAFLERIPIGSLGAENRGGLYARAEELFQVLEGYEPRYDLDQSVVLAPIRPNHYFIILHLLFGFLLAKRGCRCTVLVDDGQLAHHDKTRRALCDVEGLVEDWNRRRAQGSAMVAHLKALQRRYGQEGRLRLVSYSRLVHGFHVDVARARHDAEADLVNGRVSHHFQASHNRYFGGRAFNPENDEHLAFGRLSVENEVVSKCVGQHLLAEGAHDTLILLDGVYTTFGVLAEQLRDGGARVRIHLPVRSYSESTRGRGIAIADEPFVLSTGGEHWEHFRRHVYSDSWRRETEDLMRSRVASVGERDEKEASAWCREVARKRKAFGRVVGLFPNFTWDANFPERDLLFDRLDDWMVRTIIWARENDQCVLVREHPQQPANYHAPEGVISLLREQLPGLDTMDNVVLIPGDQAVSSYALIESGIDCSVVYSGTLGVEIPLLGRPVVIASRSRFRGKGVGFEPEDIGEYFELLGSLSSEAPAFSERQQAFYENALAAAAYQYLYSPCYCPISPRVVGPGTPKRYEDPWDMAADLVRPDRNPEWAKTLNRLVGS